MSDKLKIAIGFVALVLLIHCLDAWVLFRQPAPTPAPTPIIALEAPQGVQVGVPFVVKATTAKGNIVEWKNDPKLWASPDSLADTHSAQFMATAEGEYWICCWTATEEGWLFWRKAVPSKPVHCKFTVGTAPAPGPTPPGPTPPQPPAPKPTALRVLFLYESAKLAAMPKEQAAILTSAPLRQWLDTHTTNKAYRFFDKGVPLTNEPAFWQQAVAKGWDSLPWLAIYNQDDTTPAWKGPWPADANGVIAVLQKYAPVQRARLPPLELDFRLPWPRELALAGE